MALGKKIRLLREARGWTQQELSDRTGNVVSQGAITALEKRDSKSSSFTKILADSLGIDLDLLLLDENHPASPFNKNTSIDEIIKHSSKKTVTGLMVAQGQPMPYIARPNSANPIRDEESDFIGIKRVEFMLSAGIKGFEIATLDGDLAPVFFRKDLLNKKGWDPARLHAIEVRGESMETGLYEGDIVVVNTADTSPVDGEVYAANYEGELVIKRFIREAGQWWLTSDNQDKRRYPKKLADDTCFIVGHVVHKQSEKI
jgi:phage repressor protein C with HTH and peptisase S24 domain